MSDLVVVGFDRLEDARSAMHTMRELQHAGQVTFEDTAIVERTEDGKVHTRNELSGTTEAGAVVGGFIGLLLMVLFPIFGIVVGATIGGAIGAIMHTGVDRDFVKDVQANLAPGRSALFLVMKGGTADAIAAAMRPYKGEVIQTTLSTELEDELRRALDHEG